MNSDKLRQLIANCRRAKTRFVGRPPDHPSDWCPHKLQDPEMAVGYMFTDMSAWEYVAKLLHSGHEYKLVTLHKPPGAMALELLVDIRSSTDKLYIKIEVGRACTPIGRSFHISYKSEK